MFVQSFNINTNDNDGFSGRNCFDEYYLSLVEIKDFNILIGNKPFFDQPVRGKKKKNRMKSLSKSQETTGYLLDYSHHQIYYTLIGIDLFIYPKKKKEIQVFLNKLI